MVVEAAESLSGAKTCHMERPTVRLDVYVNKAVVVAAAAATAGLVNAHHFAGISLGFWEGFEQRFPDFALGRTGRRSPLAVQGYG